MTNSSTLSTTFDSRSFLMNPAIVKQQQDFVQGIIVHNGTTPSPQMKLTPVTEMARKMCVVSVCFSLHSPSPTSLENSSCTSEENLLTLRDNAKRAAGCKGQKVCACELCPSPAHSKKWRCVTAGTSAGGRDWGKFVGKTLCDSCYSTYRKHGTFIRSIRTNDGWSRGTDATDVCVGQGSDVGLGQGNSMGVGQGKGIGRGKGLGVARLPQANTIREPPTTAAVRADKRAKRESDGVEVEGSHETGRKQQDSFGTHTHGRACFMKRPFWVQEDDDAKSAKRQDPNSVSGGTSAGWMRARAGGLVELERDVERELLDAVAILRRSSPITSLS